MRFSFILAFVLWLLSNSALAGYNKLVVFGDSLSDSGNGSFITGGVAPATPTGRASNGPVAVELLAARLGIDDFKASRLGGTNYAVFGATTDTRNVSYLTDTPTGSSAFPEMESTGLQSQFADMVADGPLDPSTTLYLIWGGANDIFLADAMGISLPVAANGAVGNLMGLMGNLLGLGAQNILMVGMPDLGLSPFAIDRGPAAQLGLSALADGINDTLEGLIDGAAAASGANLMFYDPTTVARRIAADAESYGFTNITDQCILSPAALATNCEGYAFLDDVHPSTAIHAHFAAGMAATVGEPAASSLIAVMGLGWLVAVRRRRRASN